MNKLRELMARHLVTTKQMSKVSGMSEGNISRIINYRQKPNLENAYNLVESLNELTGKDYSIRQVFPNN